MKRITPDYSKEELEGIVKECISIRQVLARLGLSLKGGGNYKTVNSFIKDLNIDISHFKKQGWNKGVKFGPKRPIEEYLSNEVSIQSFRLKNRLIKEGIFEAVCSSCNLTRWKDVNYPARVRSH